MVAREIMRKCVLGFIVCVGVCVCVCARDVVLRLHTCTELKEVRALTKALVPELKHVIGLTKP